LKCAVVSLYSVVKQRLKCNTGKVCNCLIQFLLIMVLSIVERVFISVQRHFERTVLFPCITDLYCCLALLPHNISYYFLVLLPSIVGPSGRAVYDVGLRPLAYCDRGFESHQGHGCFSVVCVVCCQIEVSATSWSLVQRSPTDCGASLCVIKNPRVTRRP
jgi:hypothetical protein